MSKIKGERAMVKQAKLQEKQLEAAFHSASVKDCAGMTFNECSLLIDRLEFDRLSQLRARHPSKPESLLQVTDHSALASATSPSSAVADPRDLEIAALLQANAALRHQTRQLRRADTLLPTSLRLQSRELGTSSPSSSSSSSPSAAAKQPPVSESTQGQPAAAALEDVPATVTVPPQGLADFNGATAVVARLPAGQGGFTPPLLNSEGLEKRGSFVLKKASPFGGTSYRVYGPMNHRLRCTLRGYHSLPGQYRGATVYTGYKRVWSGKSTFTTGIIPDGGRGEFDLITCRDLDSGEVQHFRTIPIPPSSHDYPLS